MPRAKKCRKVCRLPNSTRFAPLGAAFAPAEAVRLAVDEYECIRLIDHEGFTQEECAGYMKIARTTVQQMYNQARRKLAISLVESKPLLIAGGHYQLCEGGEPASATVAKAPGSRKVCEVSWSDAGLCFVKPQLRHY